MEGKKPGLPENKGKSSKGQSTHHWSRDGKTVKNLPLSYQEITEEENQGSKSNGLDHVELQGKNSIRDVKIHTYLIYH